MRTSRNVISSYCRSYPHTSKAVGSARRDVVDFARACGFSGQSLCDIEVAVGEGLANAVEHGQQDNRGFDVHVRRDESALVVEIKDGGNGFDQRRVSGESPPADAQRGFGMFIMRELMDEINYTEFGTRLRLLKRLPAEASPTPSTVRA